MRYRLTLMLEFSSLGAILPSYDVETRILEYTRSSGGSNPRFFTRPRSPAPCSLLLACPALSHALTRPTCEPSRLRRSRSAIFSIWLYSHIALGLVVFFCFLEGVELAKCGAAEYFGGEAPTPQTPTPTCASLGPRASHRSRSLKPTRATDLWNVMDWANFIIYFLTFAQLSAVEHSALHPECSSAMCRDAGYFDDWQLMGEYRQAKLFLSLCVCIQLLKVLKFASALIPKVRRATGPGSLPSFSRRTYLHASLDGAPPSC